MSVPAEISHWLLQRRTAAVVGLSSNPARASFGVARYLAQQGYRIVPVNPNEREVLGERAWPRLEAIPTEVGAIEIVDVFRKPEFVPEIVEAAIARQAKLLWLQEGIRHPEAEARAAAAGLWVVADRCLLKEHLRARGNS